MQNSPKQIYYCLYIAMKKYLSNEEFFQAFGELKQRLADNGNQQAAQELKQGFACLNGLTDGWAILMSSIEKVISEDTEKLQSVDIQELEGMLEVVREIVYRK